MVGTKADLAFGRKVSFEEARELSSSLNATYLEISSVINTNVKYLFETALTELLGKVHIWKHCDDASDDDE